MVIRLKMLCSFYVGLVLMFIHVFLAKSWMKGDGVAMRVCIYASDRDKFLNPNRWPAGVVIKPWKFKTKTTNSA